MVEVVGLVEMRMMAVIGGCNPLILDVCITVSVLDTVYKIDLISLLVRLSQFQFQILFFNILDFLGFSGIFLDYFEKSP